MSPITLSFFLAIAGSTTKSKNTPTVAPKSKVEGQRDKKTRRRRHSEPANIHRRWQDHTDQEKDSSKYTTTVAPKGKVEGRCDGKTSLRNSEPADTRMLIRDHTNRDHQEKETSKQLMLSA